MKTLSPKDPRESIVISFNFENLLGDHETITSAEATSKVVSGNDPDAKNVVVGDAIIVEMVCLQRVAGGVSGATYLLSMVVNTSEDNVFALSGQMDVQYGGE